jgi:hypothetical protein
VTLDSKTLNPAQEAEIAAKLATASRLDFRTFQQRALKRPHFVQWFEQRFVAIPVLEKITPEIRDAFMVQWERDLRDIEIRENERAELDALLDADEQAATDPRSPDYDPDLLDLGDLPRRPTVRGDDADESGDDDEDGPALVPDDFTSFGERPPVPAGDDPRCMLLGEWCSKFRSLPYAFQEAWSASHIEGNAEWCGTFLDVPVLEPREGVTVQPVIAKHPAYLEFAAYTGTLRKTLARLGTKHSSSALDDIDDTEAEYVVPGMVPAGAGALTIIYAAPKSGKSALAHKLAVAVASDNLTFDGLPVMHGRVLYVTADPGARKRQVKSRFLRVMERLSVSSNGRIRLVDDPVTLNDPASVENLLKQNPGEFALVVIDPLYRCIAGSPAQDVNMSAAVAGLIRIGAQTGAAVVALHHETRNDAHLFGSVFLDAALDSQVHVVRNGDNVRATVELLKNDAAPERPFTYKLEGAFLAAVESAGKHGAPPAVHPKMLARLPVTARPVKGSQALVEDLMPDHLEKDGRETLWRRLREKWEAAGLIEVENGTIRRKP